MRTDRRGTFRCKGQAYKENGSSSWRTGGSSRWNFSACWSAKARLSSRRATYHRQLLYANDPALSAGIIDFRLGDDDAEPVCEALSRRNVPFIFFTGLSLLPQRWAATPLVQKPAVSQTIIGAVKFALSPEARDSIVKSQKSDYSSAKLARTDQLISEAEVRIGRLRRGIVRLANSGADTSAAEQVVATTIELIEGLRTHREFSAHLASKSAR